MEQNFFFVNGLKADKNSKKLMRQHVMKGKNAGKTFHRPSRTSQVIHYRPMERIARPIGSNFCSFPFPVPLTKTASKSIDDFFKLTINVIYPPSQLGFDIERDMSKWLEIMFQGKSGYEVSLVLIQALNETYLGGGYNCPNSLFCLSQTLELLKKRLGSKEALSDQTLSIIMSLINQEQLVDHYSAAEAHMAGMKRIVDLRGGLENMENLAMVAKICRTDILFTMQQSGCPTFYRDHMPQLRNLLTSRGFILQRTSKAYSIRQGRLDSVLGEALLDTMGICRLVNEHLEKKPLDIIEFQEALISICYRLLYFRTLNESRTRHDIQSAYHIGLMIFMVSIHWHNYQSRLSKPGHIAGRVKEVEGMLDEHEDEFALWLLVLGGISISVKDDRAWMLSGLRDKASVLGVTTWDEARRYLVKFPWINVIHDEPSQKLWEEVTQLDLYLHESRWS
ncbi:hypothetical protein KAF25_009506 [Fusarium avenaceum]|uniref:Uncharacterized protein n=1 Tax=Fusarium avenaceum TaxID=40199 RepID=A0A9P7KTH2_9HYPO|nr:hypothetical protein KAF25_009506 [Fusarium avenaceum]